MTNWELYVYEGRYNLSGNADHHPRLGKGTYVAHTSYLVDYELKDDVLKYETRNTIYMCPLKYMSRIPYFNVVEKYKKELMHLADKSSSDLDKIISATAKISLKTGTEDELFLTIKMYTRRTSGVNKQRRGKGTRIKCRENDN